MKIKRYIASDMRAALRQIREEQGPDAVLLSTRQVPGGVEICAAVDMELAAGHGTLAETAALKQLEQAAVQQLAQAGSDAAREWAPAGAPAAQWPGDHATGAGAGAGARAGAHAADAMPVAGSSEQASVGEELRSLRGLLEQQLAALAWNDFARREPLQVRALTELTTLGLTRDIALSIMHELPSGMTPEQAQRLPYALLARRLATVASPCERGGALALVGPPGSGKTTTLAKLAARWVVEHEAGSLAIVSGDYERLGSHEQLRTLARLLGVQIQLVNGAAEIVPRLAALGAKKMVLIDTPGCAMRDDSAVRRMLAVMRTVRPDLGAMLIVPASAQAGVIDAAVAQAEAFTAKCCALTRTDEAISLGGALSALVRSRLPLAWVSDGARIPEDLKPARAHQLVVRAMELARHGAASVDEDLLVRRYGESLHAAA